MTKRLGLLTRLVDSSPHVPPGRVYADAIEQFRSAETLGYDVGWVAQHHFDPQLGGLPAPLIFLATVAARSDRIRLGTGVITLALEDPVRVAEDAAVLDALCGGRLELGFGSGGGPGPFAVFTRNHPTARRSHTYRSAVARLVNALAGRPLDETGARLHPNGARLLAHIWQATFSSTGAARIGASGSGLLLSRHQPRPVDAPTTTLAEIQRPIVDAYTRALPPHVQPRIGVSRSVVVGRDSARLQALAEASAQRLATPLHKTGHPGRGGSWSGIHTQHSSRDLLRAMDVHIGTPDQVLDSLAADPIVATATDLIFQVHPIDPGQAETLDSLELIATEVAPALGWKPASPVSL